MLLFFRGGICHVSLKVRFLKRISSSGEFWWASDRGQSLLWSLSAEKSVEKTQDTVAE